MCFIFLTLSPPELQHYLGKKKKKKRCAIWRCRYDTRYIYIYIYIWLNGWLIGVCDVICDMMLSLERLPKRITNCYILDVHCYCQSCHDIGVYKVMIHARSLCHDNTTRNDYDSWFFFCVKEIKKTDDVGIISSCVWV